MTEPDNQDKAEQQSQDKCEDNVVKNVGIDGLVQGLDRNVCANKGVVFAAGICERLASRIGGTPFRVFFEILDF